MLVPTWRFRSLDNLPVLITLAHHWLITYRGGERVLQEFRRLFPEAPLATLICERGEIPDWIIGDRVVTSPLQYLPHFMRRRYKALFPLHAWGFRNLKAPPGSRFVLSSDAAMVKTLRIPKDAIHVCYCHSPPRYLWDLTDDYVRGLDPLSSMAFSRVGDSARVCDYAGAQRVTRFIANSRFVAGRIERFYNRAAEVVYPPVDVEAFDSGRQREGWYLIVSQLVPYKRVDLAVRACNRLRRKLVIIGEGSELGKIKALAGPTVRVMGRQPFAVVRSHLERCNAFIYPQVEDFGITAAEAQAAGAPVIAFGRGGAIETVVDGVTGLLFAEQTEDCLARAIVEFEKARDVFVAARCRENANRFSVDRFGAEIRDLLMAWFPVQFERYGWFGNNDTPRVLS